MIDLHTHTTASDGTREPAELIARARDAGLEALAITDHDTLAGFDAASAAGGAGEMELVCGIELSSRYEGRPRSVHLLGYFLGAPPAEGFRAWLGAVQAARRERNQRLVARLKELGVAIRLGDVERIGRSITGRPHFARLLVEKGYVGSREEAFGRYLGEGGSAHVPREGPSLATCIEQVRASGGLVVAAHPVRWGLDADDEAEVLSRLVEMGLQGLEVWHSDHSPEDSLRYQALATRMGLTVTGGTDYHGDTKPRIRLGVGPGHLAVSKEVLDRMRASMRA